MFYNKDIFDLRISATIKAAKPQKIKGWNFHKKCRATLAPKREEINDRNKMSKLWKSFN